MELGAVVFPGCRCDFFEAAVGDDVVVVGVFFREGDWGVGGFGEVFDCVGEVVAVVLSDEADDVAVCPAPEAVVGSGEGIDVAGRGFFLVVGAVGDATGAGGSDGVGEIGAIDFFEDGEDVVGFADFLDEFGRVEHFWVVFSGVLRCG